MFLGNGNTERPASREMDLVQQQALPKEYVNHGSKEVGISFFFHPYIEITLSCWVAIHLCIFFVSRNYSLKIHLPCQSRAAREWTSVAFTPFGFRGRDHRVETSVKCYCLQPLVDSDSMVSPNLILFSDEALLTISMVFAYLAGVVPSGQTSPRARNQNVFQHIPEPSSSHSGR